MNAAVSLKYFGSLTPLTVGVSNPSDVVAKMAREALEHFTRPIHNESPMLKLPNIFQDIVHRCRVSNWDGYDADPISDHAIIAAAEFLSCFIEELGVPDVVPEPDGELALEWCEEDGSTFSISFGQNERISYAGLFANGDRVHGSTSDNYKMASLVSFYRTRV